MATVRRKVSSRRANEGHPGSWAAGETGSWPSGESAVVDETPRVKLVGWLPMALGVLLIVLGTVWTLQGLDVLTDAQMSGQDLWAKDRAGRRGGRVDPDRPRGAAADPGQASSRGRGHASLNGS